MPIQTSCSRGNWFQRLNARPSVGVQGFRWDERYPRICDRSWRPVQTVTINGEFDKITRGHCCSYYGSISYLTLNLPIERVWFVSRISIKRRSCGWIDGLLAISDRSFQYASGIHHGRQSGNWESPSNNHQKDFLMSWTTAKMFHSASLIFSWFTSSQDLRRYSFAGQFGIYHLVI